MGVFEPCELPEDSSSQPAGPFPADFTADEREFTEALQRAFAPEREELPPLYVPTLVGDACARPIDAGFEQKVTYRVLSQLGLPRSPLFDPPLAPPARPHGALQRLGRSGAVLTACALLFMALSVVFATPSFAQGLLLLLGHTGVQQVKSYPTNVRPSASMVHHAQSASQAQQPLTWVQWFGPKVGKYSYADVEVSAPQEWSDGPVLDLRYLLSGTPAGSGVLDVREFRIAPKLSSVLQVVGQGSATSIQVGNSTGVYVDGQWAQGTPRPTWSWGVREELIFEQDGVIFWIMADHRDGLAAADLAAAAQQLAPVPLATLNMSHLTLRAAGTDLQAALANPPSDDVYALIPISGSASQGPEAFVTYAPGVPLGR